jgi:predicted SAM-dependent methyltransferase
MNLKKTVGRVVRCFLSPGQERAIRGLQAETRMAGQHRAGVWKIRQMGWTQPEKINLGSGAHLKKGFLNVDLCPEADAMLDLRRPLPFEDGCADFIFSEHCFEHFDYPEAIGAVLKECLRVLKPGGVLSFSVPETEWPVRDYEAGDQAPYFETCRKLRWHPPENRTRMEHINYHFRQGGDHRFAYDEETARKILTETGFVQIRRREFDPSLDSEHRDIGSLFMEAKKAKA